MERGTPRARSHSLAMMVLYPKEQDFSILHLCIIPCRAAALMLPAALTPAQPLFPSFCPHHASALALPRQAV